MFPEGRDGRGWSRVSGELSKALTFPEATVKAPFVGGRLLGKGSRSSFVCGGGEFEAFLPFHRWWASGPVNGGDLV
jgi:hypothetical protein